MRILSQSFISKFFKSVLFKSDPVITYDHMEDENPSTNSFRKNEIAHSNLAYVIEILVIVLVLCLLVFLI